MSCNHERRLSRWVTVDYFGEEIAGEWEYSTESTTVDLDLHRYKCTQCSEVMYYSGRARDYYTKGILSHVDGLDK